MGLWLVIGAAVVIAVVCVILLQKKAGEARKYLDELNSLKSKLDQKSTELVNVENGNNAETEAQKSIADQLSAELGSLKEQISQLNTDLADAQEKQGQAEQEKDQKAAELADLAKQLRANKGTGDETAKLADELASVKKVLANKTQELATVEKSFEEQMEEVVESSIQKITHAEQAKEEAIQAAQDNFEAAAEVNAKLKEKEALIKQLQEQKGSPSLGPGVKL